MEPNPLTALESSCFHLFGDQKVEQMCTFSRSALTQAAQLLPGQGLTSNGSGSTSQSADIPGILRKTEAKNDAGRNTLLRPEPPHRCRVTAFSGKRGRGGSGRPAFPPLAAPDKRGEAEREMSPVVNHLDALRSIWRAGTLEAALS